MPGRTPPSSSFGSAGWYTEGEEAVWKRLGIPWCVSESGRAVRKWYTILSAAALVAMLFRLFLSATSDSFSAMGTPTWSTPVNVSGNDGVSLYPKVVPDALGNVHVVWRDNTPYPYDALIFHRMRDRNGEWSSVDIVPESKVDVGVPDAAADANGTVHVVWRGVNSSSILYSSKPLSGTWSTFGLHGGPSVNDPIIRVGPLNTVHVMWGNGSYWERDAAGSGTGVTNVFPGVVNYGSVEMVVGKDGTVHAVVGDASSQEIYYSSRAPGQAWTGRVNISQNVTPSSNPKLAADSVGDVHFVWVDLGGPSNYEIFYSAMLGGDLTSASNISKMAGESYAGRLAVSPLGDVHVVWLETGPGLGGTYYTSRPVGGDWSTPNYRPYGGSNIAVSNTGDVHWLWSESNSLYHAWRSPQSGWSPPNLVHTVASLGYAKLVVGAEESVHSVWSGKQTYPGNEDIMYASFDINNTPVPSITPTFTLTPAPAPVGTSYNVYLPLVLRN